MCNTEDKKGMVIPKPPKEFTYEQLIEYGEQMQVYGERLSSGWEDTPYNEFLDIVVERHDPKLSKDQPICPFCGSKNISVTGGMSTLVGLGRSKSGKEYDPNHHWDNGACNDCHESWFIEWSQYEDDDMNVRDCVWYTKDQKVLAGIPECFEEYIYTCSKCGGDVRKHYYDKGTRNVTRTLSQSLGSNKSESSVECRGYDVYFACADCDAETVSSTRYFSRHSPHRPIKPRPPGGYRLRVGWKIIEEIGVCFMDDEAIKLIDIGDKGGG